MTKRIANFQGEVPKSSERLLAENAAQAAVNCVLERGVLTPVRLPRLEKSYPGPVGSVFKHKGRWYAWPQEGVKAAPGPVATDRLYVTGDGVPKLLVNGQTYPLALYPPEEGKVLTGEVVADEESLLIEGQQVVLEDGTEGVLPSGLRYEVNVDERKATIELTSADGVAAGVMAAAVNSIQYINLSPNPTDGTRVVQLKAITGEGEGEDGGPNTRSLSKKSTVYVGTESYEGEKGDEDLVQVGSEYLVFDDTKIRLFEGNAGTTKNGCEYTIRLDAEGCLVLKIYFPRTGPNVVRGSRFQSLIDGMKYGCDLESVEAGVRNVRLGGLFDSGWEADNFNGAMHIGYDNFVTVGGVSAYPEKEIGTYYPADDSNGVIDKPSFYSVTINPSFEIGGPDVQLFRGTRASTGDEYDSAAIGEHQVFAILFIDVFGVTNRSQSAPQLSATSLNPSFMPGDNAVSIFKDCIISAGGMGDEAKITGLSMSVDNLANGALDPDTMVTVQWAYTWVTEFDEESPPSEMTEASAMEWNPDLRVRLTGFLPPPPGRAINRQRIYRSQTSALGDTKLYFVYERPASDDDFIFDPEDPAMALGEECPSINYDPPDDGLQGITSVANGIMAGFVGKHLYFSEPYVPHAWPADYMLAFDYDIVGLATFGQYVAVLTTGRPYLVGGMQPDSMSVTRTDMDAPCISAKSIVDFAAGCLYAAPQGLVMISPAGVTLASQRYFTREQWQAMAPGAMAGGLYNGKYLGTYTIERDGEFSTGMFIMDLTGDEPFLTRYSDTCDLMFNEIGTGTLYMLKDQRYIFEWDSRSQPYAQMVWRSKRFVDTQYLNYGAILIEGEDTISEAQRLLNRQRLAANEQLLASNAAGAFSDLPLGLVPLGGSLLHPVNDQPPIFWCKVYADGRLVGTVDRMNVPVRLRSGFLAKQWEVEVGGSVRIDTISLGINPETLAQYAEG